MKPQSIGNRILAIQSSGSLEADPYDPDEFFKILKEETHLKNFSKLRLVATICAFVKEQSCAYRKMVEDEIAIRKKDGENLATTKEMK